MHGGEPEQQVEAVAPPRAASGGLLYLPLARPGMHVARGMDAVSVSHVVVHMQVPQSGEA